MDEDKQPISWKAPEFRYYEKTDAWFVTSLVIAVLVALVALWQQNILFVMFVIIAEVMVFFEGRKKPREWSYVLTARGIEMNDRRSYQLVDYEGFAIMNDKYGSPYSELILKPKKALATTPRFLVPDELADRIHGFLADLLPEVEHEDSLSEHLGRRMKF